MAVRERGALGSSGGQTNAALRDVCRCLEFPVNAGAVPGLDGPRHVSQVLLAPALPCEKTRTMIPQANETELEVVFSPLLGVRTGQIPSWKHFLRAQCKRFARGFGPWKPTDPRHPVSLGARRGFHGAEALGRTPKEKNYTAERNKFAQAQKTA